MSRVRCLFAPQAVLAAFLAAVFLDAVFLDAVPSYGQLDGILGAADKPVIKLNDKIYQASGFGNTFLVLTDDGNVVIDTSLLNTAERHHKALRLISDAPTRYIIYTHAHEDHTTGAAIWKEPETKVIAQKLFTDARAYQDRLSEFFARRNAAQFGFDERRLIEFARGRLSRVEPTIFFDEEYEFELGGTKFQLLHTPGETYEHLTVWLPEHKAAFVGDNYYASFPNLYTLRGTRPRWALDYVDSLNKIIALKPEYLLPGHGDPVIGAEKIAETLTRYRDAIQYVHDQTVKGMNAGKDVYTLMKEIKLPPELDVGDSYGKVSWSVRGIYDGYVGWFDGNPATMYAESPRQADIELVRLAGGAESVAKRATELVESGQAVDALRLTDAALAAEPGSEAAVAARTAALEALLAQSRNSNERGWLESRLRKLDATAKATSASTGSR